VEKFFKGWAKAVENENIVVGFDPEPMMGGDSVASNEGLIDFKLVLKLRTIYVDWLELDGNFALGGYVYSNVNKT
jgi:hypothetical protein